MKTSKKSIFALIAVLTSIQLLAAQGAGPVPAQLPPPDATPPAKKPVKVYILSGQSNMVGFGVLKGARPPYPSIYLSADPGVMPCRMPVGESALLPHRIYQEATGDAQGAKAAIYAGAYDPKTDYAKLKPVKETVVALGKVADELPSINGPHTLVVKAFVEVPMSGAYEMHAGFGESTDAVVTVDGKEAYRKDPGSEAAIQKVPLEKGKHYPVTITYRKSGSAAFWMELVDIKGKGDLEWVIKERGIYQCLLDDKGEWTTRNDVVFNDAYCGQGRSAPLSATANGGNIGPELGFGYVMGTFHDEPVLLIKSCIGNRSLGWDYLPPGSERYEVVEKDPSTGAEKTYIYAGYKDSPDRWEKGTEPKPFGWYAGKQYDDCTAAVHEVLNNFGTKYPEFKDHGFEVAGFVWWQGHKDTGSGVHASRYEQNLVNLIKAWRKEFKAPDAKFVLATGCGNPGREGVGLTIAVAQLAVDGESGKHPEFKGNVKTIDSRGFWRDTGESPTGTGYHYNHNAETYLLTGDALGRAMVELLGGKAEPSPGVSRPPSEPKQWPKNPTPDQAVEMLYSDAFIAPWTKDPAEPTPKQMAAMGLALRPMVTGKLIPATAAEAPGVPLYRRYGMSITTIIKGERPTTEWSQELKSQLDEIISYYNAVGIHDYDWQRVGPDMQKMSWDYFSFDPPEQQDKAKSNRYRKITYPQGMENWFAVDFDAAKAGWKTGAAPFGQKDGKLEPLSAGCRDPQCGCSIAPKTLWEKEVLLMRQCFELPALKADHRYRLVLGGSTHNFSGEGYAIYVNGKLFTESTSGFAKSGGARGGYVYSDFLPEFQSGKVTIAVKSFLRHTGYVDKLAPPRGHLSVWLEAAKVPEAVLKAVKTEATGK